jgi:hypothetical protein
VEKFDRLNQFVFSTPQDIPMFVKKLLVGEAQRHKPSNEIMLKQISSEHGELEPDLQKIGARTLVL